MNKVKDIKLEKLHKCKPFKFEDFGYKSVTGLLFLNLEDLCNLLNCGRSKAEKAMNMLPHLRFSNKKRVHGQIFADYLYEHGGTTSIGKID